jgi:hypothetical protein
MGMPAQRITHQPENNLFKLARFVIENAGRNTYSILLSIFFFQSSRFVVDRASLVKNVQIIHT